MAAAKKTVEIDGLAAAVARANLCPDVLASAAAWLAAEGASSVTQLEADDIDGALCGLAHASTHSGRCLVARLDGPPRPALLRLCGWLVGCLGTQHTLSHGLLDISLFVLV